MLSGPGQSEIQSYVTNRCQLLLHRGGGLKASENSLIRTDRALTHAPPPFCRSFSIFRLVWGIASTPPTHTHTTQWFLTNNTNVIPLACLLCHNPSWFNGPVSCQFSLFTAFKGWEVNPQVGGRTFGDSSLLSYTGLNYYQVICWEIAMIYCLLLDLTQFSRVGNRKVFISLSFFVHCLSCRLKVLQTEMASEQSLRVMLVQITEKFKRMLF